MDCVQGTGALLIDLASFASNEDDLAGILGNQLVGFGEEIVNVNAVLEANLGPVLENELVASRGKSVLVEIKRLAFARHAGKAEDPVPGIGIGPFVTEFRRERILCF